MTVREQNAVAGNAQLFADGPQRLNGYAGYAPLKIGYELRRFIDELRKLFLGHPALFPRTLDPLSDLNVDFLFGLHIPVRPHYQQCT